MIYHPHITVTLDLDLSPDIPPPALSVFFYCADGIQQMGCADGMCRWDVQMGCDQQMCRWDSTV